MFSLALYAKDPRYSKEYLIEKAFQLKKFLENVGDIDTINIYAYTDSYPFPEGISYAK